MSSSDVKSDRLAQMLLCQYSNDKCCRRSQPWCVFMLLMDVNDFIFITSSMAIVISDREGERQRAIEQPLKEGESGY